MMRSQRPLKLSKDQKHDTHPCTDRSESSFKYLVLLTLCLFSVDNMIVPTTLIALTIVHITSIFILPTSISCKTEHTYWAAMYEYCRINLVCFMDQLLVVNQSHLWKIFRNFRCYLTIRLLTLTPYHLD